MQTVLITGASRGIGESTARLFAEDGWQVLICARHGGENVDAICRETGAIFYPCDVGDEEAVRTMFAFFRTRVHHLDALVLNAGSAKHGLIQDMEPAEWDALYRTNLRSAFLCVREALPGMISQGHGSIVAVSSMWGQIGGSCEIAYSAFKAGLIGFVKALAKEAGPSGIRVNCICPGFIDTAMTRPLGQEVFDAFAEDTPLGRIGTAEECAKAIRFLCGEDASFITGQVLGVNGGLVV